MSDGTDIEHVPAPHPAQDALSIMQVQWKFAQRISKTEFVPPGFRGRPDAILAAIQYGREVGIGPMQSLQSFDVIQGKPTLKPEAMSARVRAHGHSIQVIESTDEKCILKGTRADNGDTLEAEFTMAHARALGLASKDNWKKQPKTMLFWRATGALCRGLFADVIQGLSYTPEELGATEALDDEVVADAEVVEPAVVGGTPMFLEDTSFLPGTEDTDPL